MLVESTAYKQDTVDTIYPASGPRRGNHTCCLSGCIDDCGYRGVEARASGALGLLLLRVLRVVVDCELVVALSRIKGPSCAFIAQARSKDTVSY